MAQPLEALQAGRALDPELIPLLRLLQRAKGFALAFLKCNVPVERERLVEDLIQELRAWGRSGRILKLREPVVDLLQEIQQLDPPLREGEALFVLGFESSIPADVSFPPALVKLNLARALFREFPCPLVFALPDYALTQLARQAPDFWSWRSGVFEVEMPAEAVATVMERTVPLYDRDLSGLTPERIRSHLEVLQELLGELEARGGFESERLSLSRQIASDLVALGEIEQARSYAERALKISKELGDFQAGALLTSENLGDLRSQAVTLEDIAFLRERTGDVSGALKLYEESLRIYEQLEDVGARAGTLGDIARLRARSGDVPGALRLYEEILQIFEQLGDVRSHAITAGDIARLRAQSGDVSGALKLYEEILQIFEQLGDVRSRAGALGDIERLRAQSGDVSGALKLHEERLQIFEQLGDVRSRALTLGDIARLRAQLGDAAEARKLQSERLKILREMGDLGGVANNLYDLAQLDLQEEKLEDALPRLAESWDLVNKIGHAEGIAFVGQLLGALLSAGNRPEAMAMLQSSKEAYLRLGRDQKAGEIDRMLEKLSEEKAPAQPTSGEAS